MREVKARANKGSCAWNASSMWFCNRTEKWRELQNGSGWWSFAHNESNGRNETLSLFPKERYFLFPQNGIDRSDKHSTVKSLIGYCFCAVWLGFILQKWCGMLSLPHCLSLVNVQKIEHTHSCEWRTFSEGFRPSKYTSIAIIFYVMSFTNW